MTASPTRTRHRSNLERAAILNRSVGALAHSLNNKITLVYAEIDNIEETYSPTTPAGIAASNLAAAVDQITALVNRLHELAADDFMEHGLHPVADFAAQAQRHVSAAFGAGIRIEAQVPDTLDPGRCLAVDRFHALLALDELIRNAIEASRVGRPEVVFAVEPVEGKDWFVQRVIDDGDGLNDEVLGRAFDPFFSTKQGVPRPGFGLTYCARVVSAMGGKLSLGHGPGGGTQAMMQFPIVNAGDDSGGSAS